MTLSISLVPGLSISLVPGLSISLVPGLSISLVPGLSISLVPGLSISLVPGLSIALVPGLCVGMRLVIGSYNALKYSQGGPSGKKTATGSRRQGDQPSASTLLYPSPGVAKNKARVGPCVPEGLTN